MSLVMPWLQAQYESVAEFEARFGGGHYGGRYSDDPFDERTQLEIAYDEEDQNE
jgi:hypothetical protein